MRHYTLALTLTILTGAFPGVANGAEPTATGIPTKCTIRILEPKGAEKIMLAEVTLSLFQPHGRPVYIPAELCETEYHTEWHEFNRLGEEDRAQDVYCYELRSKDSKKPFHRYLWSDIDLGRFHLWTTSTGRSYLTCISGFVCLGYEVGKTQDKSTSFSEWVLLKKPVTKELFVPVAELAGHKPFISSGMGDTCANIEVISLDESKDGQLTIKFKGADSSKTFTAASDPSSTYKWHLVPDNPPAATK